MNTLMEFGLVIAPMEKSRRGIQSIEIGSGLLLQLARQVRPVALKDLAKAAGMTAGKAHPYMVSFLKVGFVTQTEAGHYELGPLALQLGLTRLQRMDPVKEASQVIEELARETGQSVAIAVWGNLGPDHRATRGADPAFARQLAHGNGDVTCEHCNRETVRRVHAPQSRGASPLRRPYALRPWHRSKYAAHQENIRDLPRGDSQAWPVAHAGAAHSGNRRPVRAGFRFGWSYRPGHLGDGAVRNVRQRVGGGGRQSVDALCFRSIAPHRTD